MSLTNCGSKKKHGETVTKPLSDSFQLNQTTGVRTWLKLSNTGRGPGEKALLWTAFPTMGPNIRDLALGPPDMLPGRA